MPAILNRILGHRANMRSLARILHSWMTGTKVGIYKPLGDTPVGSMPCADLYQARRVRRLLGRMSPWGDVT